MASGRTDRGRGRRGRGGGGNRENEQGEHSSSQAPRQEESQPSDSLHQSNQPAGPSLPPPRHSSPPTSFRSNYQDFIKRNSQPIPSELLHTVESVFPTAEEVQRRREGSLKRRERNLAGSSQQTNQSDSSRIAWEKPVRNLPQGTTKRRRTAFNQQDSPPRLAQDQGLPQQTSVIDSQETPGLTAEKAPIQGAMAGLQSITIASGGPGSAAAVQRNEEKPLPDSRLSLDAKRDPIHGLPLNKRRLPPEIMDVDNQERVPVEVNPPEEQQGNLEDTNSNSDVDSSKGSNRKSSESK